MIYAYPIRTNTTQELKEEVIVEVDGIRLSIVKFNQQLKKLMTGSTVKFYGPSAFTYDTKTDDVHTEAMASNHIIIFEYNNDNKIIAKFKTYEFTMVR